MIQLNGAVYKVNTIIARFKCYPRNFIASQLSFYIIGSFFKYSKFIFLCLGCIFARKFHRFNGLCVEHVQLLEWNLINHSVRSYIQYGNLCDARTEDELNSQSKRTM